MFTVNIYWCTEPTTFFYYATQLYAKLVLKAVKSISVNIGYTAKFTGSNMFTCSTPNTHIPSNQYLRNSETLYNKIQSYYSYEMSQVLDIRVVLSKLLS